MKEASSLKPEISPGQNKEMEYLLERHESSPPHSQKLCLDKHVMSGADFNTDDCCTGEIKVGCLYEIDHQKLPPKSPIQLKAIRVVMVVDKTMINVSVRFPSMHSFSEYFYGAPGNKGGEKESGPMSPELDEQFVMDTNTADEVLRRSVPSSEFAQQRHLDSFWLVSPKPTLLRREAPSSSPLGICLPALNSGEMVRWGVRRKVRYVGRRQETTPPPPDFEEIESNERRKLAAKRPAETPTTSKVQKRKAPRLEKAITGTSSSKDRWSKERYEAAEMKLMDIMRAKGAVLGNPILRPELRAEARKQIGDTGLLDHLLKHMAGKVVPDRNDRFRRRHNPEGAMEYWLERADLVELRKQAGVEDPYWVPPPGWQPGDEPLLLDPAASAMEELKQLKEEMSNMKSSSTKELKQLREEIAHMKRDFEQFLWRKEQENEVVIHTTPTSIEKAQFDTDVAFSVQESSSDLLMKRKKLLEKQLEEISNSLNVLQGELRQVWEETKKEKKEKEVVRSGFRICKPEGTFLWPNSGASISPQVQLQVEDLLAVPPTPTSASSATSPRLNALLPKIRTVTVSCVRSESAHEPHNCASMWKLSGKLPQLLTDDGGEDAAELGVGNCISSSSNSTVTVRGRDHLACKEDTSAKEWLALATTTATSF